MYKISVQVHWSTFSKIYNSKIKYLSRDVVNSDVIHGLFYHSFMPFMIFVTTLEIHKSFAELFALGGTL